MPAGLRGPARPHWPARVLACLLMAAAKVAVGALEHYLGNAAHADLQCQAIALAETDGSPVAQAIDGVLGTGWSWGTELDGAEAIFVLHDMHTLTGIRVYSGHGVANGGPVVAMGRLVTRFRLWYSTSCPENRSDPMFWTGGWGMSEGRWLSIPSLQAESPDDSSVAVLDDIVLTARPDTLLHFPPLLVRALKIAVEDTQHEAVPAILNEFQAIAPRHLNPGLDAPTSIQRPARSYIWPLYNASDAWHSMGARQCQPWDSDAYGEDYPKSTHDGGLESGGQDGGDSQPIPWFHWDGALEHNESVVHGTLVAHVFVHNFAIPEQGQLELYVQNTRAAWTDEDTHIRLSIAELSYGLHVFTARLRGKDGEWLPFSDRRVVFVGAVAPAHPWLLTHSIEVVGDGLSSARVGERVQFRIHITQEQPELATSVHSSSQDQGNVNCMADGVVRAGAGRAGEGGAPTLEPWWVHSDSEHWTVELRGPAIIRGHVVQNRAVPGVYDVSYTVYDPGEYQLSIVLHYVSGHGLRDPGVGGQEDVVEHLVQGSPFRVRASASASSFKVCRPHAPASRLADAVEAHKNVPNMSAWESVETDTHDLLDARIPRPLCSGLQVCMRASQQTADKALRR